MNNLNSCHLFLPILIEATRDCTFVIREKLKNLAYIINPLSIYEKVVSSVDDELLLMVVVLPWTEYATTTGSDKCSIPCSHHHQCFGPQILCVRWNSKYSG